MTDAAVSQSLPRIGLIATDALRIMGLRTILGDGQLCEIVALSPPGAADTSNLEMAIVDTPATTDVLEVVAAFRRLRPQLPVVVLGAETDQAHIERIIGSGAKGYLSHAAKEDELRMAIQIVREGSVWAPRKVLSRLLDITLREPEKAAPVPVNLTKRELQVLKLLVMGHPNRQIAEALGVDEGTVKAHMGRLMRKAAVDNRTALSMRAIEAQWVVSG